jgi:hypothetical protein
MATEAQKRWLNSFNGHDDRMWERMSKFNKKPKAKRAKVFHMTYTLKSGKVKFKLITNKKIN